MPYSLEKSWLAWYAAYLHGLHYSGFYNVVVWLYRTLIDPSHISILTLSNHKRLFLVAGEVAGFRDENAAILW